MIRRLGASPKSPGPVRPMGTLHSGVHLYRALKQGTQLDGIPVVLVTGHDPSLIETTQPLPSILSKPFWTQQLLEQMADRLAQVKPLGVQGKATG